MTHMKTIHICLKCLGYLIEALKFKSLMHAVTNRCYQSYSILNDLNSFLHSGHRHQWRKGKVRSHPRTNNTELNVQKTRWHHSITRECSAQAQAQCGLQKWHFIPVKASQVIKCPHVWRVETDCREYMEWSGDMKTSRVVVFSAGAWTGGWWLVAALSGWKQMERAEEEVKVATSTVYSLHRHQGHTQQLQH